ncbi:MAG: glutathione peroxidase [Gammaproteobacteria bacterium]|nr:glutathione peroxidase [Gammaproteobacteria bacterium]NNF48344.1 glutathione peroxidase [Woeseiaceae bacterium]MBT8094308.1 glutathione peroxidase [Gammaproteobacteria bacterium]MBT8106001.1 glutathione peroxidase [Gammaproteobacteria bacterium]NNK26015.1 glutathione peroxidase [Woeseiaceae bacterium]
MLKNLEGKRVPDVTFRTRRDCEWVDVSSADVFEGKNVVVFSLPGAFTPTCSSSHVPRYDQLVPEFEKLGIDQVICVSVNDAFVMNEWKLAQNADRVTFLPDGNGDFTDGMGLLVDKDDLGFGRRSWRYSMLVRDGVVEKMFIEPEEPGDPFQVSDADTMLRYLDANAELPHDVALFSRDGCPFCVRAKGMLRDAGIEFEELVLNQDYTDRTLRAVSTNTTYPQVFIDGELIGGSDELAAWLAKRAQARAA